MRLINTRSIKGTITCETGLHIGGSSEGIEIGGLDMAVIKHPYTSEPYIPGSSIKGKMRSGLERSLGKGQRGEPCGCGQSDCMVCLVFGPHKNTRHSLGPTRIIVRDAALTDGARLRMQNYIRERGIALETKTENVIDRVRGVATHPRTLERVPAGTEFKLQISLQVYDSDDMEKLLATVREGLSWVEKTYLGKGGSRGSGMVSFRDLTIDGQPFTLQG